MDKIKLSRRKVLSGIAVAGGSGSLVGAGTGALFTDEEIFTGNTVRASTSTGGVVDLEVTEEDLPDDEEGVSYNILLPSGDSSTITNNPAYVWLRTLSCPSPLDLARDTQVEVTVSYDGGTTSTRTGSALRVLNEFRDGYPVGQNVGDSCLKPGEEWVIDFEVTDVEGGNSDSETLDFDLEFFAQQCRYQSGASNPFEELERCGKAISFVAFCGAPGMEPEFEGLNSRMTVVDWTTTEDVTYVVVFGGQNWTIYDYSDEQKTEGTIKTGDDPDSDFFGTITENGAQSDPCDVADAEFGDGTGFDGTSLKFELDQDNGKFEEVN